MTGTPTAEAPAAADAPFGMSDEAWAVLMAVFRAGELAERVRDARAEGRLADETDRLH